MATLTQRTELELAAEELLALHDARGTRLRLVEGSVWLTLDHDLRDVFLGPGKSFVVDRDGVTLLHALAPTRLLVESAADAAVLLPWSGWRRAVASLARRLLLPASRSGLARA
jgi:hypothetical protein